jgi:microcystin-dependent protein
MQVIEDTTVIDGEVVGDNLHLYQRDGTDINAGNVRGPVGPSAANPVPWSSVTAYTTGAIVGYAGALWKCTSNNTGHPPHLFSNEWNPIEGFDYTSQWSAKDAYFLSNDPTVAWEFFWKTGTSTPSLTQVAGEFETGDQALKLALAVSSSQTFYQKEENIVRGGEIINVIIRAKLRVASAGNPTIGAGMYQNDITGPPGPFGAGASLVASAEGNILLTTNWKTYQFTITAENGKSRAVPFVLAANGAGAAADVLVDRVEISRNKALNLNPMNVPVGTVIAWPSPILPSGWAWCSGPGKVALSRAAYPELFALIGTTYGSGDGSTTFDPPNLVGRSIMGHWAGAAYAGALGASGGEATHVLTTTEMPSHSHAQNVLANGVAGTGQRVDFVADRAFAASFPQGVSTDPAGGGAAHNVLDPYTTLNYIIRAVPSAGVDASSLQFFKGAVVANGAVAMAANTNMPFTVRTDPSNAWNATNNNWVCPQPGRYRIKVAWKANATAAARSIRILKNGSAIAQGPLEANAASAGGFFEDVLDLVPGDTISVQPTVLYTTMADGAGIENNYLIIESVGLAGLPATGWSDTGWINMQLLNGWLNYDSGLSIGGTGRVCQYRKLNGEVHFRGYMRSGANGTVCWNIPSGVRPGVQTTNELDIPLISNSALGDMIVNATANTMVYNAGSTAWVNLAGLRWIAES